MNSEIFSRLEGLMKSLSLSIEEGSYTRAEMKAYAAGIELAAQAMEETLKNLFVDTASTSGLAMFLSLIGEKPAVSQEGSRRLIKDAVSQGRRATTKIEFTLDLTIMRFSYSVSGNEIRLNIKASFGRELLGNIRKIINDYAPSTSVVTLSGNGHSFDDWDALALRWFELDGLELPFYLTESL